MQMRPGLHRSLVRLERLERKRGQLRRRYGMPPKRLLLRLRWNGDSRLLEAAVVAALELAVAAKTTVTVAGDAVVAGGGW